jgi:hypothetical protein
MGAIRPPTINAPLADRPKAKKGQRPYTKGWRAPWRGDWGGFGDKHCRLARLAHEIEAELLADYAVTTPQERRALWRAARFQALAEMQLARVGAEGKIVVSRSTKPAAVAERILSRLPRRAEQNGHDLGAALAADARKVTS